MAKEEDSPVISTTKDIITISKVVGTWVQRGATSMREIIDLFRKKHSNPRRVKTDPEALEEPARGC